MKRNWVMVTEHNYGILRDAYDPKYISRVRVGDKLPVQNRDIFAVVLRYWRKTYRRRAAKLVDIKP